MKLHSKQLGAIGVLRVAAKLMSEGYSVFAELGDLSRVDLIVLVNHQPIKIQVKTRTLKDGRITVDSRKSGPGYQYRYTLDDVDVFAIYIPEEDITLYVNAAQILNAKSMFAIRVIQSKNKQEKFVQRHHDYLEFKRALRDHTQSTRSGLPEGNDMIQTTTSV